MKNIGLISLLVSIISYIVFFLSSNRLDGPEALVPLFFLFLAFFTLGISKAKLFEAGLKDSLNP